ncbi:11136_t:CDS:2 [Acaulospora colombiana]|uniref:11136_t:CDS:1 n=1 Tax=Acaulospora colombiana TaxID=27376 RepID=A0ACA9NWJ9_9GLOM|nr:11136_t:CDS:2 [Acaulospora colombiana]
MSLFGQVAGSPPTKVRHGAKALPPACPERRPTDSRREAAGRLGRPAISALQEHQWTVAHWKVQRLTVHPDNIASCAKERVPHRDKTPTGHVRLEHSNGTSSMNQGQECSRVHGEMDTNQQYDAKDRTHARAPPNDCVGGRTAGDSQDLSRPLDESECFPQRGTTRTVARIALARFTPKPQMKKSQKPASSWGPSLDRRVAGWLGMGKQLVFGGERREQHNSVERPR